MPITAIFTTKETTLTIATAEETFLEQKSPDSSDSTRSRLAVGVNVVKVTQGVFWVVSNHGIRVSTDTVHVVSMKSKEGGPIELAQLLPPGSAADESLLNLIALKSHALR